MAVSIATVTKNFILTSLKDVTNGIIRVFIYDNSDTIIGSADTITWAAPADGEMSNTGADIVFNVPASTIVKGVNLSFWDGATLTTAITKDFDTSYSFTNSGTFTITSATLTVV